MSRSQTGGFASTRFTWGPLRPTAEALESRRLLSAAVARHVFYNHSAFDGRSARADARDDGAIAVGNIAVGKSALLPGQPVSPANYTSYTRGINGIMIDITNLPAGAALTADDFFFSVGNNGEPSSWRPAPAPRGISVRPAPDAPGKSRVTLTWRDRSIRNTWLEVTVAANADTGLAAPDVFCFGNLIGDTGDTGDTGDNADRVAVVTDDDIAGAAVNPTHEATIDNAFDFDRNGRVNADDARAVRRNRGAALYAAGPFSAGETAAMAADLPGEWQLIFHDEFSGPLLDPVWHAAQYWDHDATVIGNGELQAYDPTGLSVSGGLLRLTARKDDAHGVPYVSGMAMTGGERSLPTSPRFSFLYGYLEVRAKVPAGAGLWPAIWMMPASYHDDAGELDVLEVLGGDPDLALFTTHRGRREDVHEWAGPDLSQDFHTYGVEWRPDSITWFVDGVERARTTGRQWVVREAMYPILNLAVGGRGFPQPDGTTTFPATMEVDYLRVWQSA
jgi:beta-glucanase (GH16 family)